MQENRNITKGKPLSIGVFGASGRVGRRVLSLALEDPSFSIAYAWTRADSSHMGKDIGLLVDKEPCGTKIAAMDEMSAADVLIDFSTAEATSLLVKKALLHKKPLVIGTTGLKAEASLALKEASHHIPVLYAANFTLGIPLCMDIVRMLAKKLKGSCFIDIVETHHIHKKDMPSGTSLALASAAADYKVIAPSPKKRDANEIVIHSLRTGEIIGEHQIIFECGKERIEIKHQAHSRDAFALGALKAAQFLSQKPPGLYEIRDLLLSDES